ncbi:MAG TPA: hypothetical protein VGD08_06045 [Stellaceae bacterium]
MARGAVVGHGRAAAALAALPLLPLLAAGPPAAPAAGDAQAGRAIAQRWCSSCHALDNAKTAADAAPSFPSVARNPNRSPQWWRTWLADPHPPMSR